MRGNDGWRICSERGCSFWLASVPRLPTASATEDEGLPGGGLLALAGADGLVE